MKKKNRPAARLTPAEKRIQKQIDAAAKRAVPWRTQQVEESLQKIAVKLFRCSIALRGLMRDLEIVSIHWALINGAKGVPR